jgi:hypothetical protein
LSWKPKAIRFAKPQRVRFQVQFPACAGKAKDRLSTPNLASPAKAGASLARQYASYGSNKQIVLLNQKESASGTLSQHSLGKQEIITFPHEITSPVNSGDSKG